MSQRHWKKLRLRRATEQTEFRFRHGLGWLLYVLSLWWALQFLREARQSGGFTLFPAVVLTWVCIYTALINIEHWLAGANRYGSVRVVAVLTALVSCVLWVWMLWHTAVFLLVGVMTFFRVPLALFSLATFGEGLFFVSMGVAMFAVFAWGSLRVVLVLLSGEPQANMEQVVGNQPFGAPQQRPTSLAPSPVPVTAVPAPVAPNTAVPPRAERRRPFPPALTPAPDAAGALPAPLPAGRQRHQSRPPGLVPVVSHPLEPSVLHACAYRDGGDADQARSCAALGWPAFEWVLRTEPSMPELADALAALPNLARSVDASDALEARDWISRLADHPGAFEVDLPARDIVDPYVRTRTVRIADVALQAMLDWDHARSRTG